MTIDQINEVELEMKRFFKRLQEAKKRFAADRYAAQGCKESGALRRGAIDLKNELTKLTR